MNNERCQILPRRPTLRFVDDVVLMVVVDGLVEGGLGVALRGAGSSGGAAE